MKATRKALVGRTIADVEFRPFRGEYGQVCHNPAIILDNGRRLYFVTEETGATEYGTSLCLTAIKRTRKEPNRD